MIPFLGIGTGRCGTKSLARIIGACKNTSIAHECGAYACFWYQKNLKIFYYFREQVESNPDKVVGDVAFYWLPHIAKLRKILRLRVVCLHRDKESTVNSFLRLYDTKTRLRREDCPRLGKMPTSDYYRNWIWWNRFPLIEGESPKECWEKYWDMYERESRKIKNCYHLNLEDLNSNKELDKLFDYLRIARKDRKYIENRHHNKKKRG